MVSCGTLASIATFTLSHFFKRRSPGFHRTRYYYFLSLNKNEIFVGPLRIHHFGKLPQNTKPKIRGAQKIINATQSRPKFTREPLCSLRKTLKFSSETRKLSYRVPKYDACQEIKHLPTTSRRQLGCGPRAFPHTTGSRFPTRNGSKGLALASIRRMRNFLHFLTVM